MPAGMHRQRFDSHTVQCTRPTPGLLRFRGSEMYQVLIVFETNVFEEIPPRPEPDLETCGPGLGIRLRVLDGRLVSKREEIGPAVLFDHMQRFGTRMTHIIQPGPAVEADRVDDQ